MNDELLNALDDCLSAIIAGESVEASLARYPTLTADLRPMLEAARAAHQLAPDVTVPRAAQNASRAQFLARAAELRSPAPRRSFLAALNLNPRLLVNALGLLVAFALGAYSVSAAAAHSLPGEALYSIKRTIEQTQLTFTFDPQARVQLQERFAARRVEEVREVLAAGRVTNLEFGGVIDELNGERWTVAGLAVIVASDASLEGVPFPGLFVEVQGQTQITGIVRATAVRVTGRVFRGLVNAIGPDTWRVGEQSVLINAQTQFIGDIGLGDEVDVSARPVADESVLALRITLVESQVPPTATPTSAPTATAPPTPSATPVGTASATATRTASPTVTVSPTLTPSPTRTRLPTGTPTPDGGEEIEFTAVVESISETVWQIGGQLVFITADTEIYENPHVGDLVEVHALRDAQGLLTATRIQLEDSGSGGPTSPPGGDGGPSPTPEPTHTPDSTETAEPTETEFEGTVTAINGNLWTIGEHLVTVTGETEYEGDPGVGSFVDVNAWQYPDGTLIARRIRVH